MPSHSSSYIIPVFSVSFLQTGLHHTQKSHHQETRESNPHYSLTIGGVLPIKLYRQIFFYFSSSLDKEKRQRSKTPVLSKPLAGIEPATHPYHGCALPSELKRAILNLFFLKNSASRIRTCDSVINSHVLYRLSYCGIILYYLIKNK